MADEEKASDKNVKESSHKEQAKPEVPKEEDNQNMGDEPDKPSSAASSRPSRVRQLSHGPPSGAAAEGEASLDPKPLEESRSLSHRSLDQPGGGLVPPAGQLQGAMSFSQPGLSTVGQQDTPVGLEQPGPAFNECRSLSHPQWGAKGKQQAPVGLDQPGPKFEDTRSFSQPECGNESRNRPPTTGLDVPGPPFAESRSFSHPQWGENRPSPVLGLQQPGLPFDESRSASKPEWGANKRAQQQSGLVDMKPPSEENRAFSHPEVGAAKAPKIETSGLAQPGPSLEEARTLSEPGARGHPPKPEANPLDAPTASQSDPGLTAGKKASVPTPPKLGNKKTMYKAVPDLAERAWPTLTNVPLTVDLRGTQSAAGSATSMVTHGDPDFINDPEDIVVPADIVRVANQLNPEDERSHRVAMPASLPRTSPSLHGIATGEKRPVQGGEATESDRDVAALPSPEEESSGSSDDTDGTMQEDEGTESAQEMGEGEMVAEGAQAEDEQAEGHHGQPEIDDPPEEVPEAQAEGQAQAVQKLAEGGAEHGEAEMEIGAPSGDDDVTGEDPVGEMDASSPEKNEPATEKASE